jgi:hypothetical protein
LQWNFIFVIGIEETWGSGSEDLQVKQVKTMEATEPQITHARVI